MITRAAFSIVTIGTISATVNAGAIFWPPLDYAVGPNPAGLAVGDIDNDSDMDIVTAIQSANSVAILKNDGSGALGALEWVPISTSPQSVYLADVNADTRLDLIAPARDGRTVSVRRNNGDGTWSPSLTYSLTASSNSISSIAFGDVDGDTDVDMILAKNGSYALGGAPGSNTGVWVLKNTGTGEFAVPGTLYYSGRNPADVRFVDLDGDGARELLVGFHAIGSVVPGGLETFQNHGVAGFDATGVQVGNGGNTRFLAIGDVDGDLVPDVWAANVLNRPRAMRNMGALAFDADVVVPLLGSIRCTGFDLADIDLDGDLDCLIADYSNYVTKASRVATAINDGAGYFYPARTSPVASPTPGNSVTETGAIKVVDLNTDGYPDAIVILPDNGSVCVLFNKGSQPATDLCFADLNDDFKVDTKDFNLFASRFGTTVAPYYYGDLDGDGVVDIQDFSVIAGAFGTSCP